MINILLDRRASVCHARGVSIREQLEQQVERLLKHAASLEPSEAAPLVSAAALAVGALHLTEPTVDQTLAAIARHQPAGPRPGA